MLFYLLLVFGMFFNIFAAACLASIFISALIEMVFFVFKKLGFSYYSNYHMLDVKIFSKIIVAVLIFDLLVLFFIRII